MGFRLRRKKERQNSKSSIESVPSKKRRPSWGLRIGLTIVALIILAGGAMAARVAMSLSKVVQKHSGVSADGLKGELELSSLKGEGEGRVNILLLGTGDPGHDGEGLTDTIIVVSIDPKSNDVVMLGIPRDLYVKIPGIGWDRINAAHALAEQQEADSGPGLAKKTISEVIGQPIHYFVRVDFSGLKEAVNALGGVDIYNPTDLSDPSYPCEQNEGRQCGFKLKAGYYHMDGALALQYARCRKGNCGDDYGRSRRQQGVVVAMRDQAIKLGNILNPSKINKLLDVVGDHMRTDINLDEMKRLMELGQKINSNNVANKVIDNQDEGLVMSRDVGGASVLVPTAGNGNFSAIRSHVRSLFTDGYVKLEEAKVEIQNGRARSGAAYTLSSLLRSYGYNIVKTVATQGDESQTRIIDYSDGQNPYTVKYLENRLGVSAERSQKPANATSEILIILGESYKP